MWTCTKHICGQITVKPFELSCLKDFICLGLEIALFPTFQSICPVPVYFSPDALIDRRAPSTRHNIPLHHGSQVSFMLLNFSWTKTMCFEKKYLFWPLMDKLWNVRISNPTARDYQRVIYIALAFLFVFEMCLVNIYSVAGCGGNTQAYRFIF